MILLLFIHCLLLLPLCVGVLCWVPSLCGVVLGARLSRGIKRHVNLLYDWRESCLLIGPICLHKSLYLPENLTKQAYMC